MIKAVIFDVDGTLLDTERIYVHAWKEAGKSMGYDIPDSVMLRTRAVNKVDAKKIFAEALGENFSYETVHKIRTKIAEDIIHSRNDLLRPGVLPTLEYLRKRQLPIAVASSTKLDKTEDHLQHTGLLANFQVVVGGDMVQKSKPNPDIFLLAASMLGVPPENCLVVEDTPAGIEAAHAAGMCPVLIPDYVTPNEQTKALCFRVLQQMDQLIPILEELIG